MTTIVDTLRKQKKMIVLGAALAVITLYIIPVDQIASALTGIDNAIAHLDLVRARIQANSHIPDDVQIRLDAHLEALQGHLAETGYRIDSST